jgi:hypothetical protein
MNIIIPIKVKKNERGESPENKKENKRNYVARVSSSVTRVHTQLNRIT